MCDGGGCEGGAEEVCCCVTVDAEDLIFVVSRVQHMGGEEGHLVLSTFSTSDYHISQLGHNQSHQSFSNH